MTQPLCATMTPTACFFIVALFSVGLAGIYRQLIRRSIKHIRGPHGSFLRGNLREFFFQTNVGDMDFRLAEEYGLVWRMNAPLGQDVLVVADPKALQHIFHRSGYGYGKHVESTVSNDMLGGKSILYAPSGSSHARHRKVMNPAFSALQLRSFLPTFRQSAAKLCQLLREEVQEGSASRGNLVAINKWLARTTLDLIGETALHYEFGALDNSQNEVSKVYENMFVKVRLHPSMFDTIFRATWRFLPLRVLELIKYVPWRRFNALRATRKVVDKVAASLVEQAIQDAKVIEIEKGKKDVMSVLVRANSSENPSLQLSKEEMMAQMGALILAGHETTANTLTWLLWELAKNPCFQDTLRNEIREKREEINSRDDISSPNDFSMDDLESMPFLQALVKEVMRFHPIVYHLIRVAKKDDVIPLSEPIVSVDGRPVDHIPISKGQTILVSICTYNRIKKIWGEDADQFNPMRFVDRTIQPEYKLGMYGNLMTFSAGLRGCIGWRFSLIEMQAIIVALIEAFRFSLPPDQHKIEIVRKPLGLMSPMVKDRLTEGVLMPLVVDIL